MTHNIQGEDAFNPAFVDTSSTERLDCDLIISCIGYGNAPLDQSVPFEKGRILQKQGRVSDLPGDDFFNILTQNSFVS